MWNRMEREETYAKDRERETSRYKRYWRTVDSREDQARSLAKELNRCYDFVAMSRDFHNAESLKTNIAEQARYGILVERLTETQSDTAMTYLENLINNNLETLRRISPYMERKTIRSYFYFNDLTRILTFLRSRMEQKHLDYYWIADEFNLAMNAKAWINDNENKKKELESFLAFAEPYWSKWRDDKQERVKINSKVATQASPYEISRFINTFPELWPMDDSMNRVQNFVDSLGVDKKNFAIKVLEYVENRDIYLNEREDKGYAMGLKVMGKYPCIYSWEYLERKLSAGESKWEMLQMETYINTVRIDRGIPFLIKVTEGGKVFDADSRRNSWIGLDGRIEEIKEAQYCDKAVEWLEICRRAEKEEFRKCELEGIICKFKEDICARETDK